MANIENLKKAFNHILLNVIEGDFSMSHYRKGDVFNAGLYGNRINSDTTHECRSIGCIIGHCSILDSKENFYKYEGFGAWSENFFSIKMFSDEWEFLFTGSWSEFTQSATKEQALLRLAYFIEFRSLPDGFWKPSNDGMDEVHNYQLVMPIQELKPYIINE